MGTKAAVGPAIWTRLPPSRDTTIPPMMAVKMPMAGAGSGVARPAGMLATPRASARGSAMRPTVTPESASAVAWGRV